jgi:dihydrofolate synthase/folylpolyglutamate synthase
MSERDDEFDDTVEPDEPFDDSLTDEEHAELEAGHPLADLSPFADGFEGTNIDDDSDFELEDSEYAKDAALVYEELLARVGEQAPQPRLEATRRAVELLGDPQRTYPVIHITGTNGKTSTSRIIESILRAYGLRTGLMTSPHLVRVNERIVIDGRAISNRALAANWADIRPFLLMVDAELLAKSEEPLTCSKLAWAASGIRPTLPMVKSQCLAPSPSITLTVWARQSLRLPARRRE